MLLLLAGGGAAAPARPYVPPRPPVITLTAEDGEYHTAQTTLSRFIHALQKGNRVRATSFLSSRVTQAERDAMVRKEWLRYDPKDRKNVMQVLYWRDLQIHTQRIYPGAVDLAVVSRSIPLKPKPKGAPSGILKVRMRKEGVDWRVELHAPRSKRR